MVANYHTHTVRCRHAVGSEREYIENAIQAGMKVLGFSDHAPQFFRNGYVSETRMSPSEAPEYVSTLRRLAEEYKNDIEILVGFEAEYFPDIFEDLRKFCRDYGVDYLILGQHYLDFESKERWVAVPSEHDRERITAYVDQVLEALSTGSFTYVAHPDVFCYRDDEQIFMRDMKRLCRAAKDAGVPLEINMLGYTTGRHYPCDWFCRAAAETGNEIVIGCDAHNPATLSDLDGQRRVREYAESFGLHPVDTVPLRKI